MQEQAAQSLRATAGYRDAVAAFHKSQSQPAFMGELLKLADVVLAAILK